MTTVSTQRFDRAIWAHVLPFLAWVVVMELPIESPAWRYAVQAIAGLCLFAWARPWQYYPALSVRTVPLAVVVGVAVFVIWVLPETVAFSRFPRLQDLYLLYAKRPIGMIAGVPLHSPYAPETCGWGLSIVRLAGSAFVIAVLEEFFWRGFLYRWLVHRDFTAIDPRIRHVWAFLVMALLFGLEHDRWLVGIVAGVAYGALYARTRDIWAAAVAHVTTNLLLGLYILAYGQYRFW